MYQYTQLPRWYNLQTHLKLDYAALTPINNGHRNVSVNMMNFVVFRFHCCFNIIIYANTRYFVKRSDVTRWKQVYIRPPWRHSVKSRLYKTPPPYFIVLASSVKTKEVKVIEFRIIVLVFVLDLVCWDLWFVIARHNFEARNNKNEVSIGRAETGGVTPFRTRGCPWSYIIKKNHIQLATA